MDGDPSKPHQSLFPLETCPPPRVTDEAFNLFHSIDRELYTRLIRNLGRDAAESVQVMAFWMWLERETNDMNLIRRMLLLPPALLNELADETETCLKCVETDRFQFGDSNNEMTLLSGLLSCPSAVSLRFFHENRIAVLRGVTKIINTVCSRAFGDILRGAWLGNVAAVYLAADGGAAIMGGGRTHEVGESSRQAPPMVYHHPRVNSNVPFVPLPPEITVGGLNMMPPPQAAAAHLLPPAVCRAPSMVPTDAIGIPIQMLAAAGSFPEYDLGAQRQMLSNELGEMLSRNLSFNPREETRIGGVGNEEDVAPDDRTIFLTFSKGYPITEDEVREFFTRKFGDFIEDLIMQEVGEDEQVLYARMVARSAAVIDPIVGGNKAKYSINGKHVWARKYVKKQQQQSRLSPPKGDHDPSSSTNNSGLEAVAGSNSPSTSTAPPGEHS